MSKMKRFTIILFFLIIVFCSISFAQDNAENPFGVLEFLHWNHSWNSYKYPNRTELEKVIGLIKESGAGWVRMDFVWGDIEAQKGNFNFTNYDLIVELLEKNGIKILGILDYSADWASACGQWNCAPRDNQLFVDYVKVVISRYKEKVKYWEVWNEPDSRAYWQEQDGLKSYCLLLKEVYLAAKSIDPECKILNGGLAGMLGVNQLYDHGAKDYFDILNIHLFESPLNLGAEKRILAYPKLAYKIMKRNGDAHKKIWITESGCPGVRRGVKTRNWWMGRNPNEGQQATWVKEVFSQLLQYPAVDKVFWAFFRDCKEHFKSGVDYFGLVRWDFSRKPAFCTYKEIYNKFSNNQSPP